MPTRGLVASAVLVAAALAALFFVLVPFVAHAIDGRYPVHGTPRGTMTGSSAIVTPAPDSGCTFPAEFPCTFGG